MGTGRILINILVVLVALAGGFYQLKLKPLLIRGGKFGRVVQAIGNTDCYGVPEVKACEKIVFHQPSGTLYLACSTPLTRTQWLPPVLKFNTSAAGTDYFATYNPSTKEVTRLSLTGFTDTRGLSLVGLDVVPSSSDPSLLWVYAINHRPPLGEDPNKVGADSAVEIFQATVGQTVLRHVRTVQDQKIVTPNDVAGSSDGKSFYVTNDHRSKVGFVVRNLEMFGIGKSTIVYCQVDEGCKDATGGLIGNNGITQAANGTVYAPAQLTGGLRVLESQADHSLVQVDEIDVDRAMDNVVLDAEGHVWAAAFPDGLSLLKHVGNPTVEISPTTVYRFSQNTGREAFFGQNYKVETVFEDDGKIASGTTSAAYDIERRLLFMHGVAAPQLTVCKV